MAGYPLLSQSRHFSILPALQPLHRGSLLCLVSMAADRGVTRMIPGLHCNLAHRCMGLSGAAWPAISAFAGTARRIFMFEELACPRTLLEYQSRPRKLERS